MAQAPTTSIRFQAEHFSWAAGVFELRGRWSGDGVEALGRVRLLVNVDGRRRNLGAQDGMTASSRGRWTARFTCSHAPDPGIAAALKVAGRELPLPAPDTGQGPPKRTERAPIVRPPVVQAPIVYAPPSAARRETPKPLPQTPRREAPPQRPSAAPRVTPVPAAVPAPSPITPVPAAAPPPAVSQRRPLAAADPAGPEALLESLRAERAALEDVRERLARERRAAEEVVARLSAGRASYGSSHESSYQQRPLAAPVSRRAPVMQNFRPPAPEPQDSAMVFVLAGLIAFMFLIVLIVIF